MAEKDKTLQNVIMAICALGVVAAVAVVCVIVAIATLFYIGVLNPRNVTPTSCTFPPGISCSSFNLHPDGSLDLRVGQATGHNIQITNVSCTKNTMGAGRWDAQNVQIGNGEMAALGPITCTEADGTTPAAGPSGDFAKLKIYLAYTEVDTGTQRQIAGDMSARYN